MAVLDEPLSIRQLEVFVALVDHGSFTRAARHLGLSQSTVSGHVADLERRLGARVVERGRRQVHATAAGEALLAPARETLKAERTTRMAVQELTGLLRGHLVLGGSTIPATYLLPGLLARFHALHPEISLRLVTGDSREILERILASDVEMGVVGVPAEGAGLVSWKIAQDRLVLVLPPGHPWRSRPFVPAVEVAQAPLVLREEGSGTREAALALLARAGAAVPPSRLRVVCEVGSTEAIKAAVRAGLGVAMVSDLAVRDEIASGSLATVAVPGFDRPRPLSLVARKDAWLGPAARAFQAVARAGAS
jgi:DNA-binding transcriptional LysR family regulator